MTALKITYMDSQCILSIGASERILLNSLTIAQDITLEKNKLQVMGKDNKTFNLFISDSGKIYYKNNNNYKLEITNLSVSVASELGIIDQHSGKSGYSFLKDTFYNKIMVEALNSEKWENRLTLAAVEKKNKIINEWSNYTNINVEKCRESLNMCLSLEKCINQIVGKNVYNKEGILIAQKGELISNSLLRTLLKNEVFDITIKYKPNIAGYILKEKIQFNKISKGIKVTNFLKGLDTSLNGCGYVYKDIQTNICFEENTLITPDILDFLYEMGLDSLLASKAKSSTVTEPIRFYHEVIGNRMVRIESLDIKNDIYNSNDWIYYPTYKQLGIAAFNEINREKLQPKNLTGYDILALINFSCGSKELPNIFKAPQRDIDFVKEVHTISEIFSKCLRKAMSYYASIRRNNFKKSILGEAGSFENEMKYINKMFVKNLNDTKLLRMADFTNPLSHITQINRLVTLTQSKHMSTADMRIIQPGHKGNLDPFDTPSGGKIGLVNSKTLRSILINGQLASPYYPIISEGSKKFIGKNIVYLTTRQKSLYKVSGILDLEWENEKDIFNSPIKDTNIIAEVPVSGDSHKNVTYETISSYELDYVDAYSDQTLSASTALIPFLGADEGARASFADSMLRQAVQLLYSSAPTVYTSLYKSIIRQTDYLIRAKKDGEIINITATKIHVVYTDNTKEEIPLTRIYVKNGAVSVFESKKRKGDIFKKGDILANTLLSQKGRLSIGVDGFAAYMPWYGENYEDGTVMTEAFSQKMISPSVNTVKVTYRENKYISKVKSEIIGTYIKSGDNIFTIGTDKIRAKLGTSGIMYDFIKTIEDDESIDFTAKLINLDSAQPGDKFSGRHGNKGVDTIVIKNSKAPYFFNGKRIDIILNPMGVGGRMNLGQILEGTAGFVFHLLGISLETDSYNGLSTYELNRLLKFVHMVANLDIETACNNFRDIPDFIKDLAHKRYEYIRSWKGCFNSDGSAWLINPNTGKYFWNPVMIGYSYILKLSHEVEHKRHERGGITGVKYTQVYKSPTKGSKNGGGQRIGEMEVWALEAYGASANLEEVLNHKSDNTYSRRFIESLNVSEKNIEDFNLDDSRPRSLEIFNANLRALGYEMNFPYGNGPTKKNITAYALNLDGEKATNKDNNIDILEKLKNFYS